jgi:hypothetical protein
LQGKLQTRKDPSSQTNFNHIHIMGKISIRFLCFNCTQKFCLADFQQLKNFQIEYQDDIAIVRFNQENSKVKFDFTKLNLFTN